MAFNPFLSMNEPAAPVTTEALNPFMMSTDPAPDAIGGADNPFAAGNPFSDFGGGEYDPPAGDTVPIDIFGGEEPTGAKHFDVFEHDVNMDAFTNQPVKPTDLDLMSSNMDAFPSSEIDDRNPPSRPLPPETQSLILSVTGQMEFTSSHLLDRIPPTRTPSPVSVRDIHSPSPTPEPEPIEDSVPEPAQPTPPPTSSKPARPPPARPPPVSRPPPPRPAPPPVPQQPQRPPPPHRPDDEINLFDAPVPAPVKPTKEDILSLYSAPKRQEKQIDFLSDDILDHPTADAVKETSAGPAVSAAPHDVPASTVTELNFEDNSETISNEPEMPVAETSTSPKAQSDSFVPMDCSEPPTNAATPALSNTSPFADSNIDDFQPKSCKGERNPFETGAEEDTFAGTGANIFGVEAEDAAMSTDGDALEPVPRDAFPEPAIADYHNKQHNIFDNSASGPFASGDRDNNIFGVGAEDAFGAVQEAPSADPGWGDASEAMTHDAFPESQDAFDAFSAKFDNTAANHMNTGAWGEEGGADDSPAGFEAEAFDSFLSMGAPPPPAATPRLQHDGSRESTDDTFSVFIRPKEPEAGGESGAVPVLAPPPRPQAQPESPRVNPFDKSGFEAHTVEPKIEAEGRRSGGETPPTPLFDEDVSVPLEDIPRTKYDGPGWEMQLRQPNKKKITGQRFWKKVFVRVGTVGDNPAVQLFNAAGDKEPFQELPLQACYSVSEVGAQQFDQFGKIFTVKLQYVFYKERPGVRPGQVTKAERITTKLSQFAAYAIQGDYQGVKEFGSDLRKLGPPVEHAPQVSQLFKLGSLSYEDVKQFSCCVEEALFRLGALRDRALAYKLEEVQVTAVDELHVQQDAEGRVLSQVARVRLFFLSFLSGMPTVELGVNDLRRQGREVVGRHDIIPVVTEEWIRVEAPEFHACVTPQDFHDTQIIRFRPPDACYIELMRFRVRPPKNRELPLQLKAAWCVNGNKVELRADVLVPGFASRALGQVPCEDVAVRFPIPECWIYLFRVEKHFRYGSVKSAHRRTGKIKGIERLLGAVDAAPESLIEVTSGQAKYEHQHRAVVWRMPRLPKEGQGAYTSHNLVCRMALTSYDQVPERLAEHAYVEFTMPAAVVSHVTVRSVALSNTDSDPPEKYVRYLARHEYTVGIERTSGEDVAAYAAAARVPAAPAPAPAPPVPQPPSSDSDSD